MKKLISIFILPLTLLMAEMTLTGTQLSITNNTHTPNPTDLTKTNWGFQPFSIPNESVTVQAGGNIQAAIDSLPNGGTIKLEAGNFSGSYIRLKSNIVLQGAGIDKTIISFTVGDALPLIQAHGGRGDKNIIIRDFTADCTGTTNANGIEFVYGATNVLAENIEVFGAGKSNLISYNTSWTEQGKNITFRNINSHDTVEQHGIAMRFVEGAIVENYESDNVNGYGIDFSRVKYGEIANASISGAGFGATKYPGSNYIYIHDSSFTDNKFVGIKFNALKEDINAGIMYFHIENTRVINSEGGIVDWGDSSAPQTFAEIVLIGNTIEGNEYNDVRVRGCNAAHEYGDNIGLTIPRAGTVNSISHPTGTPKDNNVGWTSWPSI